MYSNSESIVGKARSITLKNINKVVGFEPTQFNQYNFGTTNNYSNTTVIGDHTVDYYYPSLDAKNYTTNTSANPKIYSVIFYAEGVGWSTVASDKIYLCNSSADGAYVSQSSYEQQVRPVVVLGSEVKLEKVQ